MEILEQMFLLDSVILVQEIFYSSFYSVQDEINSVLVQFLLFLQQSF